MPFDANRFLLPITPPAKMDFGQSFGQGRDLALKREQLRRMREQLEEDKRHNAESERLAREREAGENARAQLLAQRELDDDRRAALEQVYKYRDAGDVEGIESRLPQLNALGMTAERQGEGRYRFGMDAAADERAEGEHLAQVMPEGPEESAVQSLNRLNALGGPLRNERTPVDISEPGIRTSDDNDAANRFTAAVEHHNRTGQAIRGPDAPDWLGSVPNDVVDIGAEQAAIRQRLDPALGALQNAYPEHQRESVGQTNQAAAGMNLPATEALKLAQSLRGTVDPEVARVQEHDWEVEDAERAHQQKLEEEGAKAQAAANKPLTRTEIESIAKGGEARAEEAFKNRNLDKLTTTVDAGETVLRLLQDEHPNTDGMIGFQMTRMLGSIGPQSNKDVAIALSLDSASTIDQIAERINQIVNGGFTEMRKEELIKVVTDALEAQEENAYQFLDAIEESANMTTDPEVARGLREYAARNVPQELRDTWQQDRDANGGTPSRTQSSGLDDFEEEPTGAAEPDAEFEETLELAAVENDLDPEAMRAIIGPESGGQGNAVNAQSGATGIIQFMPSVARSLGTSVEELRQMTPAQQVPYAVQYFKSKGITADSPADDYALAVAAPAFIGQPDETVVYKKGSAAWQQNPAWRPSGGGDITVGDILSFYGLRDSAEEEAPEAPAETPRNPLDQSVLDILRP